MNSRANAARVIHQIITHGRSLSDALSGCFFKGQARQDQAFIQALCYGVCRHYFRLNALAGLLVEKPLKIKDQDIYSLILIGLYQLLDMRVPPHAAVAETVAAASEFKKPWAKGLINAVLRGYQRDAESLQERLSKNAEAYYLHPAWLIEKLKKDWPAQWESVLQANNQHPPLVLRVNQRRMTRECYLEKLGQPTLFAPYGILLEQPIDVMELPGFNEGEISIQDSAAQLAVPLLALAPGQRILDACAAPGGKTAHILEMQPDITELVAVDHSEVRMQRVIDNLKRLNLSAQCLVSDVGDTAQWWDGQLFDRILLDAPCTASGVIRRHPDIKLLRKPNDIEKLGKEQRRLLEAVWPTLKQGGLLLYVTCSLFPEENNYMIQSFLHAHSDAKEDKITASWGLECPVGRQILPGMHNMDGFYFVTLRKCT